MQLCALLRAHAELIKKLIWNFARMRGQYQASTKGAAAAWLRQITLHQIKPRQSLTFCLYKNKTQLSKGTM